MVVLSTVPGLSVKVIVDGQAAQEYNDPDDQTSSRRDRPWKSCYIEAKSGAAFSIKAVSIPQLALPSPYDSVVATVKIDGTVVATRVLKHQHPYVFDIRSADELLCTAAQSFEKNFVFASIQSVEDDDTPASFNLHDMKSVGLIDVEFEHAIWGVTVHPSTPKQHQEAQEMKISEKAMKGRALSHSTKLSKGPATAPRRMVSVTKRTYFGGCRFKYLSRAALEYCMILPASGPSPEPTTVAQVMKSSEPQSQNVLGKRVKREVDLTPENNATSGYSLPKRPKLSQSG